LHLINPRPHEIITSKSQEKTTRQKTWGNHMSMQVCAHIFQQFNL
jgi:hypothetical protein